MDLSINPTFSVVGLEGRACGRELRLHLTPPVLFNTESAQDCGDSLV